MLGFVAEFCKISPRLGRKEAEAAKIVEKKLVDFNVPFVRQFFKSAVPLCLKAELKADGELIPCLGSSLVSGQIPNAKYLVSAFGYSGEKKPYNINYNPITDEISVVDFYPFPSVTISRQSLMKVFMAKKVSGKVRVRKEFFESRNILIGNLKNPENIVFSHYDSVIGDGALDNAGAVAVMLSTIVTKRALLKNTLFVFAGNEEISYDSYKTKSGYGFRVFEAKYGELLVNCRKIIVIDGVGISKPSYSQQGLSMVFQVRMLDKIKNKVFWLQNDQTKVLRFFHTKADTVHNLRERYLQAVQRFLINKLVS
jgi:hypothetical protein